MLGVLDEYHDGDMAVIDRIAKRWPMYSSFFSLDEMQPPVSAGQLAQVLAMRL